MEWTHLEGVVASAALGDCGRHLEGVCESRLIKIQKQEKKRNGDNPSL
jgi:hypothetical protein